MDCEAMALEDILAIGDETTWNPEEWGWDSRSFQATPAQGVEARAFKRQCSGLAHAKTVLPPLFSSSAIATDSVSAYTGFVLPTPSTTQQGEERRDREVHTEVEKSGSTCQVEACAKDLSHLSTYHQRCRICEIHIKESVFMRAGIPQRFCQQCGRCHPLDAFHGQKRSCIEQLAKHNARRRRRQNKTDSKSEATSLSEASLGLAHPANSALSPEVLTASVAVQRQGSMRPPRSSLCIASQTFSDQSIMEAAAPPAGRMLPLLGSMPLEEGLHRAGTPDAASLSQQPCDCGCVTQAIPPGSGARQITSHLAGSESRHAADCTQAMQGLNPTDATIQPPVPPQLEGQQQLDAWRLALALMEEAHQPQQPLQYRSQTLPMQLSIKLFHCTPADLPKDMRHQLTSWLNSAPAGAECMIRPGCVHLTLRLILSPAQVSQEASAAVQKIASQLLSTQSPPWSDASFWIQASAEVGFVSKGRLQSVQSVSPQLPSRLGFLAVQPVGREDDGVEGRTPDTSLDAGTSVETGIHRGVPLALHIGSSIELVMAVVSDAAEAEMEGVRWSAHMNGKGLSCTCSFSAASQVRTVRIRLPRAVQLGAVQLLSEKDGFLLHSQLILLCPSPTLVTELNNLSSRDPHSASDFLSDLGLVMDSILDEVPKQALAARLCLYACKGGFVHSLGWILKSLSHTLQSADSAGFALQHECALHNQVSCMRTILKQSNIEVNPEGPAGITPLHIAALRGSLDMVRLLADHLPPDAWTELRTDDGLSPLDFCMRSKHHDLEAAMRSQNGSPPRCLGSDAPRQTASHLLTDGVPVVSGEMLRQTRSAVGLQSQQRDDAPSFVKRAVARDTTNVFPSLLPIVHEGRSDVCCGRLPSHSFLGRSAACLGEARAH